MRPEWRLVVVQLVFSILAEVPKLAAPLLAVLGAHPDFLHFFQMIAAVQSAGVEFLFSDWQPVPLLVSLPVPAQAPVLGLLKRLGVLH